MLGRRVGHLVEESLQGACLTSLKDHCLSLGDCTLEDERQIVQRRRRARASCRFRPQVTHDGFAEDELAPIEVELDRHSRKPHGRLY
jgi:hypothetical protein